MKAQKIAVIILLCIIQSCAKESSFLPCNITFKGSLDEAVKSNSYLASGVQTSLFVFNKFENCSTNLTPGILLISDGFFGLYPTEYVILQSDLYDFYSMSFNNFSNPDIFFNANFIAIPENYRDYLWASKQSEYVYGNNYIQFIYKHISTKINIIVTSPESFSNVSINHIKFTLPNCSSSFIDLKKGEIASASAVLALSELNGIGNSRTFITIPCHAQKQIEISVNATIDGEPINDLIYRSYIDNHFIGGVSYTVNVNIENLSNSSISFICNDWNYNSNYIPY